MNKTTKIIIFSLTGLLAAIATYVYVIKPSMERGKKNSRVMLFTNVRKNK
jgi:ribose/xylose/arabinose/galactoside ABC-type transport system permease subunit